MQGELKHSEQDGISHGWSIGRVAAAGRRAGESGKEDKNPRCQAYTESCRQREGSHLSLQDLGMLQSICSRDVGRWAAERVSSPALWQNRAWKSQGLCLELRPGWGPSV